jgi:hypothetical protein
VTNRVVEFVDDFEDFAAGLAHHSTAFPAGAAKGCEASTKRTKATAFAAVPTQCL